MTDQIKGKFSQIYLATSAFLLHFVQLHFHGSLTLTSMQGCLDHGSDVGKFNITGYAHIFTHFLAAKISSTKLLTEWQFAWKVVQGLTLYYIIFKIVTL